MKVAISTDEGFVSAHFGRCPVFTVIEIKEDKLVKQEVIDNPGHEPGFLPQFFSAMGVKCIIAGGMGTQALELFAQKGIKTITGITGKTEEVIAQLLKGELSGGESLCQSGLGKGYGVERIECNHEK